MRALIRQTQISGLFTERASPNGNGSKTGCNRRVTLAAADPSRFRARLQKAVLSTSKEIHLIMRAERAPVAIHMPIGL